MTSEMQVTGLEKRLANLRPYRRGENHHTRRRALETARMQFELSKIEALKRQYDPDRTLSGIDVDRICLAAKHLTIAHFMDDPTACVRSTRTAELLLSHVRRQQPTPPRSMASYEAETPLNQYLAGEGE